MKRIRYLRNQIVHSDDSFDEAIVAQNDIYFIRDFYNRILNQFDPLSLYRKSKEVIKKHTMTALKKDNLPNCNMPNSSMNNVTNVSKRSKTLFFALLATVIAVAVVIIMEHIL